MILGMWRRLSWSVALTSIGVLAGCAAHPPAASIGPQTSTQTVAMTTYAKQLVGIMRDDRALGRIMVQNHVTKPLGVGLLIEPDGFVKNAIMVRSNQPAPIAKAIEDHLLYVNFGRFLPGMPDRALGFVVPVSPPPADAVAGMNAAPAAPGFHLQSIALYQPNPVLVARVGTAPPLAFYMRQLEATLTAFFAAQRVQQGVTAALVMGVKPGLHARAWLVTGANHLPAALVARIKAAAEAVPPLPVTGGPIAFAIQFTVWGGGAPITDAKNLVPFPPQWYQGAPKGGVEVPDGVFARIWP